MKSRIIFSWRISAVSIDVSRFHWRKKKIITHLQFVNAAPELMIQFCSVLLSLSPSSFLSLSTLHLCNPFGQLRTVIVCVAQQFETARIRAAPRFSSCGVWQLLPLRVCQCQCETRVVFSFRQLAREWEKKNSQSISGARSSVLCVKRWEDAIEQDVKFAAKVRAARGVPVCVVIRLLGEAEGAKVDFTHKTSPPHARWVCWRVVRDRAARG